MWVIWILGAVGFPTLAAMGVEIRLEMLGGYGGIVTYMLWATRRDKDNDDEDDPRHRNVRR
jgi:hypothetical protein